MNSSLRTFACAAATLMVAAGCSRSPEQAATTAPPPKAAIGSWGFDRDGMDTSVKPGDDFYRYVNGKWLQTSKIPPDLTRWGAFTQLAVETEAQIQDIIKGLPDKPAPGSARYVTDGVESCVAQAKAAAGERDIVLHGAATAQACLRAGLLDELELQLIPVLLGQGRRLFEDQPPDHVELELLRALDGPAVQHLRYRVRSEG